MQARPDRETAIQLKAGESLFVYLKAGSTVANTMTSASGQLRLSGAPRWLGEQMFRAQTTLADGEVWHIEEGGWVKLTADRGGSTVHIGQAEAPSLLKDWLRKTASVFVPGRTARTA